MLLAQVFPQFFYAEAIMTEDTTKGLLGILMILSLSSVYTAIFERVFKKKPQGVIFYCSLPFVILATLLAILCILTANGYNPR